MIFILEITSLIFTIVFSVYGIIYDFKDKNNAITRQGKIAIGGLIISLTMNVTTKFLERDLEFDEERKSQITELNEALSNAKKHQQYVDKLEGLLGKSNENLILTESNFEISEKNYSNIVIANKLSNSISKRTKLTLGLQDDILRSETKSLEDLDKITLAQKKDAEKLSNLVDEQNHVLNEVRKLSTPLTSIAFGFNVTYNFNHSFFDRFKEYLIRNNIWNESNPISYYYSSEDLFPKEISKKDRSDRMDVWALLNLYCGHVSFTDSTGALIKYDMGLCVRSGVNEMPIDLWKVLGDQDSFLGNSLEEEKFYIVKIDWKKNKLTQFITYKNPSINVNTANYKSYFDLINKNFNIEFNQYWSTETDLNLSLGNDFTMVFGPSFDIQKQFGLTVKTDSSFEQEVGETIIK